jgi:uncharacterized membrane protein YccC
VTVQDRIDQTSRAALALATGSAPPASFAPPYREPRGLWETLRDAAVTRSPSLRHAIQVAAASIVALLVARVLTPGHMSWIVVTTLAVLQPHSAATFGRVVERVIGTVLGCTVAAVLVATVHSPVALTLVMIPLSAASVITRPRSYRLFVLFLTPVFVLMADHLHASMHTLLARIGDVMVGAAIALVATAVFPTWERARLPATLDALRDALARYTEVAFGAWATGSHRLPELAFARRQVGVALEEAEASLERMLAEPARTRDDPAPAVFLVTYGRRLSSALTAFDALGESVDPADATAVRDFVLAALRHQPLPELQRVPHSLGRVVEYARLVAQLQR